MRLRAGRAALWSAIVVTSGAVAAAQEQPSTPAGQPFDTRPFERLFSKPYENERTHQSLDINTMMTEGYEDLPQPDDGLTPALQKPLLSSLLQSSLRYGRQGRRLTIKFDGVGTMRYYPGFQQQVTPDAIGTGTQELRLGRKSALWFTESAGWEPFRWTNQIVDETWFYTDPDAAPTVQVNDYTFDTTERIFMYNGAARYSTEVARGTLALGYEFQRSTGAPELDFNSQRAFFRYSKPVARHASLRVGYGERRARFGPASTGTPARDRDVDAGIDVDQPISASRRTWVRFSTGSSITSFQGQHQFYLTGSASIRHQIGRTWTAQLAYMRGVQMIEGFAAPALTDTLTVGVSGFLTRRVKLETALDGQVGTLAPGAARFDRYDASAALSIDLTRHASFVTRYVAQQYDPRNGAAALLTMPFRTRGQAVRIGMTFWMDALR